MEAFDVSGEVKRDHKRFGDELYVEALESRLLLSASQELVGVIGGVDLLDERLGFDLDTSSYFLPGPLDTPGPVDTPGSDDASVLSLTPSAAPSSYMLIDNWGGTWHDAEKSPSNTEDDLMCWAAAASNVLAWTGWGQVSGMTTTDQMFSYYQDHWTDQGGLAQFGWGWWFDGVNDTAGWSGWSQVDVAGANFFPAENLGDYLHTSSNDAAAMTTVDTYLHAGYGVTLGVYGPGGHAITVWGYTYDPDDSTSYRGIYISDSDDTKWTDDAPDSLRCYDVAFSNGRWYLQDFYGSDSWYIGLVEGLEAKPGGGAPGNQAPVISGLPDATLAENTQRDNAIDLWGYAWDAETADSGLVFTITNVSQSDVGVSIDSGRWIDIAPTAGWFGTSTVTVRVSDGELTSTDTFEIVVTEEVVPATPQSLPFAEDFSSGRPSYVDGWEYYSTEQGRIDVAGGALRLDDSVAGSTYSLNEAILHLDLAGASSVTLTFDHTTSGDESHAMADSFSGHANADGVAVSADGVTWHKVTGLTTSFTGRTIGLDAVVSGASISYTSDFMIKFQQYDNYSWGTDGRSFDNIAVAIGPAPSGTTIATWTQGGVTVTALDMNGGLDASAGSFLVSFGSGNVVNSIQLRGNASCNGVALVITGASRVNRITDARTNTSASLSFIAADCSIRAVTLKGNIAGFDLNGKTVAGMTFAADVDGDGNTSDLTSVYSGGALGTVTSSGGTVQSDITASSIGRIMITNGSLTGDLTATSGNVAGVMALNGSIGGAFGNSITSAGKVGMLMAKSVNSAISSNDITTRSVAMIMTLGGGFAGSVNTPGGIGLVLTMGGDMSASLTAGLGVPLIMSLAMRGAGGTVSGAINAGSGVGLVMALGGNITGDISAGGNISTIMALGGNITGDISSTGGSVSMVMALGGNITGDISSTGGGVRMVMALNGSINGNITASKSVGMIMALNGNIAGAITSTTGAITHVMALNGSILGNISAGTNIGMIMAIGGSINGANIGAGGNITGIMTTGSGDVTNTNVRATGNLTIFMCGRNVTNTVVTAANITLIRAGNNVTTSVFSAGYIMGTNFVIGGPGEVLKAGNIGTVMIGNNLDRTDIVAGVGHGGDAVFGNVNDISSGGGKVGSVSARNLLLTTGAARDYGIEAGSPGAVLNVSDRLTRTRIAQSDGRTLLTPGQRYYARVL